MLSFVPFASSPLKEALLYKAMVKMPSQKVDLVMWAKNGSKFLPQVLKRIEVVSSSQVKQKILVDDHSSDSTVKIAKDFNWKVYENPSTGISSGSNEALKHVESPYFISFEQDLLLAKDWWQKIPQHLEKPKVAVASGMRLADKPVGLRKLQQYVAKKYRRETELASWLKSRKMSAFTLGKTLDNTMYRTKVIRALGGFPKMSCNAGVDAVLAYKVEKAGFRWIVDYNVQSTHLRQGLKQELHHQQFYASTLHEVWRKLGEEADSPPPITKSGILFRLTISPATGVFIACKTREPSIIYIHPLIRLYYVKGLLAGG
jgi:glycosyltransferase involved in cell wall biosynthesis